MLLVLEAKAGEPVNNVSLFQHAWDECIELQVRPKDVWVSQTIATLSQMERYEIAVMNSDGTPLGACTLAKDPWDAHVGPCWAVFAQYVVPEARLQGVSGKLMREALRIARANAATVLAFTHRQGPWRYETIYRKINMKSPKIDNSGAEAAARAQERASQAAANLQKNLSQDLSTENVVQAVAGGSADASGTGGGDNRKRRQGSGLASQLGVNY